MDDGVAAMANRLLGLSPDMDAASPAHGSNGVPVQEPHGGLFCDSLGGGSVATAGANVGGGFQFDFDFHPELESYCSILEAFLQGCPPDGLPVSQNTAGAVAMPNMDGTAPAGSSNGVPVQGHRGDPFYSPAVSSSPTAFYSEESDGSLFIREDVLPRSEPDEHHGAVEEIPAGGHDLYDGRVQLTDDKSVAETAARLFSATDNGGGYDATGNNPIVQMTAMSFSAFGNGSGDCYVNGGAGATVPLNGHPHPPAVSMSSGTLGSQSSCACVGGAADPNPHANIVVADESTKQCDHNDTNRTSQYHGVSSKAVKGYRGVYRVRGRYFASISIKKRGGQVYLGTYDTVGKAARVFDLASLKYRGKSATTNFPIENYKEDLDEMENMTPHEFKAHLRKGRMSSRIRTSSYRGVSRVGERWRVRMRLDKKTVYRQMFSTQEEAAEAYDVAAIKYHGLKAITNFDIEQYDVDKIMGSDILLPAQQVRRKD